MSGDVNMAGVENALQTWIAGGAGLPGSSVVWAQQGKGRPSDPWITLNTISLEIVGVDFTKPSANPASNGHDGQELILTTYGTRRGMLSVQCFAEDPSGRSAMAILMDVVGAAYQPDVRALLNKNRVGLSWFRPVRSVGAAINRTQFEPRAVFEVVFFATSIAVATTTYIERVKIDPTLDGVALPELVIPPE